MVHIKRASGGASNEYPQHMFSSRNKKTVYLIPTLIKIYGYIIFLLFNLQTAVFIRYIHITWVIYCPVRTGRLWCRRIWSWDKLPQRDKVCSPSRQRTLTENSRTSQTAQVSVFFQRTFKEGVLFLYKERSCIVHASGKAFLLTRKSLSLSCSWNMCFEHPLDWFLQ